MGKTEKHVKFINKPKRSKVDVHMMWSAIGILLIISGMNKADGADCELAAEGNCRRVERQVLIDGGMTSMEAWKFVRMFKKRHTTKESCTAYCATGFPKWPQSCCTWDSKYKQCFFMRGYEWTEYSATEKAKWGGEDARYLRSGCMTDTAAAAAAKAAAESAAAAPKPKTSQWCTFYLSRGIQARNNACDANGSCNPVEKSRSCTCPPAYKYQCNADDDHGCVKC